MAIWLVKARPRISKLQELKERLDSGEIAAMRPFGVALYEGMRNARLKRDEGFAYWEEEDYCHPPLAQEKRAVLDHYFDDLSVIEDAKEHGSAWKRISKLPSMWDENTETTR
jgi:hypothetical protein